MTKFKKGDKVRRINTPNNEIFVGQECIVDGVDHFGWLKLVGYDHYQYGSNPIHFELVTPTTFEVGKKYQLKTPWSNNIYIVEFVSPITGTALATTESGGKIISARLGPLSEYKEITPPPPEEWRALFYRENSKPEVSAATFSSKEECDRIYPKNCFGPYHYMYAIRTDINAKKENTNAD